MPPHPSPWMSTAMSPSRCSRKVPPEWRNSSKASIKTHKGETKGERKLHLPLHNPIPNISNNISLPIQTKTPEVLTTSGVSILAEKEGFEPSIPFWGIHDFQSCALGQLRDFSICVSSCRLAYNTIYNLFCQALFFLFSKNFSLNYLREKSVCINGQIDSGRAENRNRLC